MAGSDKTPSEQGEAGPRARTPQDDEDDALAASSLSRVPRVPLIVGSTLLLLLLSFLTAVAVRQGDLAAKRSGVPADSARPSSARESVSQQPAPVVELPSPTNVPAAEAATPAQAPLDAVPPSTPVEEATPTLGPAQVKVRSAPMTAGAAADPTTGAPQPAP